MENNKQSEWKTIHQPFAIRLILGLTLATVGLGTLWATVAFFLAALRAHQ